MSKPLRGKGSSKATVSKSGTAISNNAKPICTRCSKVVNDILDETLSCEGCGSWIHSSCVGLDASFTDTEFTLFDAFSALRASAFGELLSFHCHHCNQDKSRLNSKITNLDTKVESINVTLAAVNTGLAEIKNKLASNATLAEDLHLAPKSYASAVLDGPKSLEETVKIVQQVTVDEKHDRSLVIFGLSESDSDHLNATALCRSLDVTATPIEVYRLGRTRIGNEGKVSPSPRPLRVVFASSSVARSVLFSAKHLKNSVQYQSVFLKKSLTKKELSTLSALRVTRDTYRRSNTEKTTKYVIINDQLAKIVKCEIREDGSLGRGEWDKSFKPDVGFLEQNN